MKILPMTLIRTGGLPLGAWTALANGMPDWAALQDAEKSSAEQLLNSFDEALMPLPNSPLRTVIYNARKDFFQRRKLPSLTTESIIQHEKSLIKLSDSLNFWHKTQQAKQAAEAIFKQNLAANFQTLQTIACNETLQRSLLFASHDLLANIPAFFEKPVYQFGKKDRRTAFSLAQYLARAVFKTSPLGRFTTVQVKALENIHLPPDRVGEWHNFRPLVTPNVGLLPAIYEVLLREPAFFQSLNVVLNPCISEPLRDETNWLYFDGEREAFQHIDQNPAADFVVRTLLENQRKMPCGTLIELLENEVDASAEQLQQLVSQLIDIGLLEWELPERGLSPKWCGSLYQYLGYLPSSLVLTEAAYLLHWLRTAARTMPFQTIEEVKNLQCESIREAKSFCEKWNGKMPAIPPEQIFFEDVAQETLVDIPGGIIESLVNQLAECWQLKDLLEMPPFRARLNDFADKFLEEGEHMDFLEFSKKFLEYNGKATDGAAESLVSKTGKSSIKKVIPRYQGKAGALLQIFQEQGTYKAVVNAMYAGGGKMFARWLPLFPAQVLENLHQWQNSENRNSASFPWQGWSNANFQPEISSLSLAVPDGRVLHFPSGQPILLSQIAVRKDDHGGCQLFDKQSGKSIILNDLGLEAPETRPPVMQILWHLGVPYVSVDALLPERIEIECIGEIRHRKRVEYQSLVLARETWELPAEICANLFPTKTGKSQAERIGLGIATLKRISIPRRFFTQFTGRREKPQFFDMESPVSMVLLEKYMRTASGNLRITEMLPLPDQWLGDRATEFVIEFQ